MSIPWGFENLQQKEKTPARTGTRTRKHRNKKKTTLSQEYCPVWHGILPKPAVCCTPTNIAKITGAHDFTETRAKLFVSTLSHNAPYFTFQNSYNLLGWPCKDSPTVHNHLKMIKRTAVSILYTIRRRTRGTTFSWVIDSAIAGARIPNMMSNLKTRASSVPLIIPGKPSLTTASRLRCSHLRQKQADQSQHCAGNIATSFSPWATVQGETKVL